MTFTDRVILVVAIGGIALAWKMAKDQREGRELVKAHLQRQAQERQAGSVCLYSRATDGRKGWTKDWQPLLDRGGGTFFGSQAECERDYERSTGTTAKR